MNIFNDENNPSLGINKSGLDKIKNYINKKKEFKDDSSSDEGVFSLDDFKQKENKNKNENNVDNLFNHNMLNKKRKRELTQEQLEDKMIEKYCKRNEEILNKIDKIKNNKEIEKKDLNKLMHLLAIDLIDTKKLQNPKSLISFKKRKFFNQLMDLYVDDYKTFWYNFTNHEKTNGKAGDINSSNIKRAKKIYECVIEHRKNNSVENIEDKKKLTIREVIEKKMEREKELEELDNDMLGYDPDISDSDEDELDSSIDESFDSEVEEEINKINEKENEEREKDKKFIEEDLKKYMDKIDEISIFN